LQALYAAPGEAVKGDEQEGEVEDQGDGGAGDELADGLDTMEPGYQGAGGAQLEVRQGQAQEVA